MVRPNDQRALGQQIRAGLNIGERIAGYTWKGILSPDDVVEDIKNKAHQMRVELDPSASPAANTFVGEFKRNLNIGKNQGKLGFDVGSVVLGGPAAKLAAKLGVRMAASPAKFLDQGFSPAQAAYLAEPYVGMGHHAIPRRYKLPRLFGGGPVPEAFSESVFNILKPEGISRGDFYELHRKVDPHFQAARFPASVGGGVWHGRKLGINPYGLAGRLWFGTPPPMKARVGGTVSSVGGLLYTDGEDQR